MTSPGTDDSDERAQPGPSILAAVGKAFDASQKRRPGQPPVSDAMGVASGERGTLVLVLLSSPDPDLRRGAAESLAAAAPGTALSAIGRALADPDDGVRSAVVRLAAAEGERSAPLVLPLMADRDWPLTQLAALEAAPKLAPGLADRDLGPFCAAIGRMDPSPFGPEALALRSVARAVGGARVARALGAGGTTALGAARILHAEGSPAALRALATIRAGQSPELRRLSATASSLLRPTASYGAELAAPAEADEVRQEELIASLAGSLGDPDETVRGRAAEGLSSVPTDMVAGWAEQALREGSAAAAATAATAVSVLSIASCAGSVLVRAAAAPLEARAPFLRALSSLDLPPDELLGLVRDTPAPLRPAAVQLASLTGGRSLLRVMNPLLQDSAGPVRMAVLDALAESGEPEDMALVEDRAANDTSAAVRATALRALARAGGTARLAAMARALEDPDPDVRATAVEALVPGASDAEAELYIRALRDRDDRVWRAALHQIGQLPESSDGELWEVVEDGPDAKLEELVAAIESWGQDRLAAIALSHVKSPDPAGRALAVELAARAGTAECAAAVGAALDDPHPAVRRTAAAALSTLRTPGAVTALARSLFDPQAEVRVEAVRALGVIDDDTVPGILISALKDPEVRVRNMAAEALTKWRSPAVARRLVAALGSPDLRRATGEVLRSMGETAVEPLVEAAAAGQPGTSTAAGALLGAIIGPERFLSALASIDTADRLLAVRVLGVIGGPVAFEGLLSGLADPDARVRTDAVRLLGESGDARAVKALRRVFLGDPLAEVASAAEVALRALGSVPPAAGDMVVFDEDRLDIPEGP
jgi:HEAT repeat protein